MSYNYNQNQGPPPNYGTPQQPYGQQQQYSTSFHQTSGGNQQPPPGADPQLFFWFKAVDTDNSGTLTAAELQKALINDNTGTINFNEFAGLWRYIEDWKKCFQTFDADRSGTVNFQELKTALKTFGYNLSDNFVNLLIKKYDKY
ncbi:14396_t:CDS:2, partial [Racocetra fulgida]